MWCESLYDNDYQNNFGDKIWKNTRHQSFDINQLFEGEIQTTLTRKHQNSSHFFNGRQKIIHHSHQQYPQYFKRNCVGEIICFTCFPAFVPQYVDASYFYLGVDDRLSSFEEETVMHDLLMLIFFKEKWQLRRHVLFRSGGLCSFWAWG